jgi:hypothetical protein
MGLGFHRVPEEDKDINPAFGDTGPDLLVPTQRSAEEFMDGLAEGLFQKGSGGPGGVQPVLGQGVLVIDSPFDQFTFFIVMGYQRDPFRAAHFSLGDLHVSLFVQSRQGNLVLRRI